MFSRKERRLEESYLDKGTHEPKFDTMFLFKFFLVFISHIHQWPHINFLESCQHCCNILGRFESRSFMRKFAGREEGKAHLSAIRCLIRVILTRFSERSPTAFAGAGAAAGDGGAGAGFSADLAAGAGAGEDGDWELEGAGEAAF
jgi:hypothetical protein